jgi:hypothetical protein
LQSVFLFILKAIKKQGTVTFIYIAENITTAGKSGGCLLLNYPSS